MRWVTYNIDILIQKLIVELTFFSQVDITLILYHIKEQTATNNLQSNIQGACLYMSILSR